MRDIIQCQNTFDKSDNDYEDGSYPSSSLTSHNIDVQDDGSASNRFSKMSDDSDGNKEFL